MNQRLVEIRLRWTFWLGVTGMLIYAVACTKDKALSVELLEDCNNNVFTYDDDMIPIFEASCATGLGPGTGCHDAWIFNYNAVMAKVEDGTIYNRVLVIEDMPVPNNTHGIPPLTEEDKIKIECWILFGAKEN